MKKKIIRNVPCPRYDDGSSGCLWEIRGIKNHPKIKTEKRQRPKKQNRYISLRFGKQSRSVR